MSNLVKPLISEEDIGCRISELADEISDDYEDVIEPVLVLCILKGAVNFFSDLVLELRMDVRYEFVGLSSYEGSESTGVIKSTTSIPNVIGKHVLIVEDIVDTGLTLAHLKKELGQQWPTSLKSCALLSKPSRREVEIKVEYVGFEIPDQFVVGYGLDYDGRYRNLPYIGEIVSEL